LAEIPLLCCELTIFSKKSVCVRSIDRLIPYLLSTCRYPGSNSRRGTLGGEARTNKPGGRLTSRMGTTPSHRLAGGTAKVCGGTGKGRCSGLGRRLHRGPLVMECALHMIHLRGHHPGGVTPIFADGCVPPGPRIPTHPNTKNRKIPTHPNTKNRQIPTHPNTKI
jgi:hypothetical protein